MKRKSNKLSSTFIRVSKQVLAKGESLWSNTAGVFFTSCEFSSHEVIKAFLDDADSRVLEWAKTLPEEQSAKVKRTWQTSYLGVFRACQKARAKGTAENLSAFLNDSKPLSLHKCRELLGTAPKPKTATTTATTATTSTTSTATGNKDAVKPASNPPMIKAQTVKTVDALYDAILPAFEMARETILKFGKGKAKFTNEQGLALAALSESLDSAFKALADLIE